MMRLSLRFMPRLLPLYETSRGARFWARVAAFVALGTLAAGAAAPASPAQAARAATLALAKRYWYGRRAVRLRDWAERRPRGARIALFTAAAAALVFVAELPFSWYIGFVRERRF